MTWLWNSRGREPAKHSVVPDWRVPADLRPGSAGTLWDQSADMRDVVAIILDLGVRGFLRIREVPSDGLLRGVDDDSFAGKLLHTLGFTKTDWDLERIKITGEESLVLCSQSLFRFADLGDDGLCRGDPDKGCGVIVSAIDVVVDRVALVRAGRKPADNRVSPRNPPGETRIRSCPSLQRAACYLLRLMLLSVLSRKRMAS